MQDIVELERRMTAAMERIGLGLDRMARPATVADNASDEIARLTEALDEERMANAQLNERLRVLKEREADGPENGSENTSGSGASEEMQAQLATQADEIATLRRVLAEAGKEIAALRAARSAEAADIAEIVAALEPLVTEAETGGPHA